MPPDQNKDAKDRPGVIAPPPLIFAAVFFAGWLLRSLLPMRAFLVPAIPFAIPSFAIAVWALVVMGRAKTNVDPYRPTTALVTSGPFAFTRNPIYLAMTMAFTLIQFERMQQRIERLSITDPLTGLYNRRGFARQLDAQCDNAPRISKHAHSEAMPN